MKTELSKCLQLLDGNFSLVTVSENKVPNYAWKKNQTEKLSKEEFELRYNYTGGITLKDGRKMEATSGIGIITGFEKLEVIDVDLKVFASEVERNDFFNEYISFLKDNIFDFENKFIIVRTRNFGYHILYRCEKITGNKKIAVLKGMTEAVIESRGIGGYVWIYDKFYQGNSYNDIKEISIEDRELLWQCSAYYNHISNIEVDIQKYKTIEIQQKENDLKVWDDYNERTSIFDLIRNEFTIIRKLNDKTIIRRNGAQSPHSGYIFDNSRAMYLFSTGTIYPNETLLTPFAVYTFQKHNGNYSAAAKDLYYQGYGSRMKPTEKFTVSKKEIIKTDSFPIDIFPESIQKYIYETQRTLNASIDYLGCSLLWVISLCVGNTMKIEIKKGWVEAGVIWMAIVGHAGIGKSHNINAMINPLLDVNLREIKQYSEQLKKYIEYEKLSKKEKQTTEEILEPEKTQFIVGDITIESFFDYHEQNKIGIGIYRDELSGWIKDLNKYRAGSDLETFLSCWSNQQINLTRKTAKSSFVPKAYVPIIGGVQPSILSMHYTSENKENGFIDRWLLCYPELQVERYNEEEISEKLLEWYKNYIISLFNNIRDNWVKFDDYGNIINYKCRFNEESKKEWIRIFNKITDLQNSENENEYLKSILPKQKSYVARFALLLNVLYCYDDGNTNPDYVTKKAILGAEKLSDYFIKMAKKNKIETMEQNEIKDTIKRSGKTNTYEQFEAIYKANKNINKTKIAEELSVSRQTITTWMKEIESVK
jgi:hypothetical protein